MEFVPTMNSHCITQILLYLLMQVLWFSHFMFCDFISFLFTKLVLYFFRNRRKIHMQSNLHFWISCEKCGTGVFISSKIHLHLKLFIFRVTEIRLSFFCNRINFIPIHWLEFTRGFVTAAVCFFVFASFCTENLSSRATVFKKISKAIAVLEWQCGENHCRIENWVAVQRWENESQLSH